MRAAASAMAVSAVAVGLICGASVFAATPQPGSFSGSTSQAEGKVTFTVPAAGGTVLGFAAEMTATCTKQDAPTQVVEVGLTPKPSILVRENGFSYAGPFSFYSDSKPIGSGKGTVSGSFVSDQVATGSMRFPWNFSSNAGLLSGYHCDTGKVTFQASRSVDTAATASGCSVPRLKGKKLKVAKRAVRRANCRVGKVVRRHSQVKRGRLIRQRPRPGTQRGVGAPVKLIVSRGPH